MYNNSDSRFILHFLTSTASNLPQVPFKFSPFVSRAPQRPPYYHLQTNILLIIYILVLPYTNINMLFNTLTVLGFAAVALAGTQ
jgi:hypothetical protein